MDGVLHLMGDHGWRLGGCRQQCNEEICLAECVIATHSAWMRFRSR
jgi:hypothetical protein